MKWVTVLSLVCFRSNFTFFKILVCMNLIPSLLVWPSSALILFVESNSSPPEDGVLHLLLMLGIPLLFCSLGESVRPTHSAFDVIQSYRRESVESDLSRAAATSFHPPIFRSTEGEGRSFNS